MELIFGLALLAAAAYGGYKLGSQEDSPRKGKPGHRNQPR